MLTVSTAVPVASVTCATVNERIGDDMARNTRVRKPVPLRTGQTLRITFDSKVGLMAHGGYKLYKVIPSGTPVPALGETWDVEVMTTWENTENRNMYPYTVVVRLISKVA